MTDAGARDAGPGEDATLAPTDSAETTDPAAALVDEETGEITLPPGMDPVEVNAPLAEHARLALWALGIAIVALVVSFFVGWGFPLGIAAVIIAVFAIRRPWESRAVAVWALVLGALSVVYSAGWLVFAALVMSSR